MRLLALALAAYALCLTSASHAQQSDERTSESSLPKPEWISRPKVEDVLAVWPVEALRKKIGGSAVIRCTLVTSGMLEKCSVLSEEPAGSGFGNAALLLAKSFLAKSPGAEAVIRIPIRFDNSAGMGLGQGRLRTVLQTAPWVSAPTPADVDAAFPKEASSVEFGRVVFECNISLTGSLQGCVKGIEHPDGVGFQEAGKGLLKLFRVGSLETVRKDSNTSVQVPIHFFNPAMAKPEPRLVSDPDWIAMPTPEVMQSLYPQKAIAAGVLVGRASATCVVDGSGSLTNCVVRTESPAGLDFGATAIAVAGKMRMNLWTRGGLSVVGQQVNVPFRFEASEAPKPAAPSAP